MAAQSIHRSQDYSAPYCCAPLKSAGKAALVDWTPRRLSATGVQILGDELRALRRLQREQEPKSPFVFTSERGAPFSPAEFARMIERAGILAKLAFKAHPHMLRHACGYKLANDGHDTRALQAYLGHKNIQHTVRYTELAPTRFKEKVIGSPSNLVANR
jgi:site-specific recombinase XerD